MTVAGEVSPFCLGVLLIVGAKDAAFNPQVVESSFRAADLCEPEEDLSPWVQPSTPFQVAGSFFAGYEIRYVAEGGARRTLFVRLGARKAKEEDGVWRSTYTVHVQPGNAGHEGRKVKLLQVGSISITSDGGVEADTVEDDAGKLKPEDLSAFEFLVEQARQRLARFDGCMDRTSVFRLARRVIERAGGFAYVARRQISFIPNPGRDAALRMKMLEDSERAGVDISEALSEGESLIAPDEVAGYRKFLRTLSFLQGLNRASDDLSGGGFTAVVVAIYPQNEHATAQVKASALSSLRERYDNLKERVLRVVKVGAKPRGTTFESVEGDFDALYATAEFYQGLLEADTSRVTSELALLSRLCEHRKSLGRGLTEGEIQKITGGSSYPTAVERL